MATPMVETISQVLIKPSSPTPQSLSSLPLSSVDQLMPLMHLSIAFFYPNHALENQSLIGQKLRDSLSKTLVSYYPFAGQLVKNDYIHCNDQGVLFVELKIHCSMNDVSQDLVFPVEIVDRQEHGLIVQLSHFDCGGIAITLSLSHKLSDASTIFLFIHDWATSTRLSSHVPAPVFVADSLFPQRLDLPLMPYVPPKNVVSRKFIFSSESIERLKVKAVESNIERPTRAEVVTALIYHCALVSTDSSRPSALFQSINLRSFFGQSENSVGNIISCFFLLNKGDVCDFSTLIGQLRNEKLKLKEVPKEKLSYDSRLGELEEFMKEVNIEREAFDVYMFTSWLGFPRYDVDFGWGKPTLMSELQPELKNSIVITQSLNGEIKVLVSFEEEQMSAFEKNEELLSFASLASLPSGILIM